MSIVPGAADWLQIAVEKPFQLNARSWPYPEFWDRLRKISGIEVKQPELLAEIGGTWHSPTGMLRAAASSIRLVSASNAPPVEHLRAQAEFRNERMFLRPSTFELGGQPVRVEGELPLNEDSLRLAVKGKLPDLRAAQAHLEIVRAPAKAFMRYLPRVLQPLGTIPVQADLHPGGNISGALSVDQLTTVPLGSLGAIRDITGTIRVEESTLRLDGLH